MSLISDIIKKIKFCKEADRIGPDLPFTHWRLYFKSTMIKLCKKKFYHFGVNADFRAGAYAINCSNISLGENVVIRPGSMLFGDKTEKIIIEDNVMIGSGVHFYVSNHKFDRIDIPIIAQGHYPAKQVVIKKGAWIGANVIILPGVVVGENSVIGAGSVVTKDIPNFALAAGNPARIIKRLDE